MNDSDLLRNYLTHRSDDAFRAVIDQYVKMVYASCRRQLRDRHLAEDATQAVFVLLSRKASSIRHTNLAGWLLVTARYTCAKIQKMERRRLRRETAAAMDKSPESEPVNDELLAILDGGLSSLKSSDREAIALRYLQDRPLADVGQALGVTEEAARKRVNRGVEKLRTYFARKGIAAPAAALPAILADQAHAALTPHIQASITSGILHACHGGVAASPSIVALAKGTNMMIQIARAKITAMALLVAVAVTTGGWWSAKRVFADGAKPQVAASPAPIQTAATTGNQPDVATYQACRQVLVSIIDAYERNDAAALNSLLYLSADADPQMVAIMPGSIDMDLAVYRVQKSATARFGAQAVGLRYYWTTSVATMDDLLSRIDLKSAQISDDVTMLTPSAPLFPHDGIWPAAPIYFHNDGGVWKLDMGETMKLHLQFHRRKPIPGETLTQTVLAADKAVIDAMNAISADIDSGKIADPGQLQKRLDGAFIGVSMTFAQFNVNMTPK